VNGLINSSGAQPNEKAAASERIKPTALVQDNVTTRRSWHSTQTGTSGRFMSEGCGRTVLDG